MMDVPRAGSVMVAVVRRSQPSHETLVKIPERPPSVRKKDAPASILRHRIFEAAGHSVQGFVPGNPSPFAFPAFPFSNHRELGPFIVFDQRNPRRTAGAHGPVDPCGVGVALDKGADPVLHVDLDGAAHRAHSANAVNFFRGHNSPLTMTS